MIKNILSHFNESDLVEIKISYDTQYCVTLVSDGYDMYYAFSSSVDNALKEVYDFVLLNFKKELS